jgi:hypothetical protein
VVAVTVGERGRGRAANRERAQADPGIPGFLRAPDFARNPSALSARTLRPTGPRQPPSAVLSLSFHSSPSGGESETGRAALLLD